MDTQQQEIACADPAPNNEPEAVTVNAILERYERDCLDGLAPRTKQDYLRHLPVLRRCFGERIAADLKPRDFGPFMDIPGRGKQQCNKRLAILSSAFTNAVQRWYMLERNVCREIKRHPSKPRDRLVSQEEYEGVRALAPLRIQLEMDLAVITGQRQGDILSFKWADIKDGHLHVYQSKTGKRIAIELSKDLKKVLGHCWKLREGIAEPDPNIIINMEGKRYTSDGFRSCWQRAMRFWKASGGKSYTNHDLRALAATRCATPEEAMRLLGHSNISMTLRVYRRGVERVKALELPQAA